MEQLCSMLKPLANKRIIFMSWALTNLNLYLFKKPLKDYAISVGLNSTPMVLDTMNYYTPDEGYEALSVLGVDGRHAYRLANYTDFILPFLLFLALSLPNVALGKRCRYVIGPLTYMISDYIENIAQKYVLEIYPQRNDTIMRLACYAGLIKLAFLSGSLLILVIHVFKWVITPKTESESSNEKQKDN
jgi:hypothetical protein